MVSQCVWTENIRYSWSICVWICWSKRLSHQNSYDSENLQKVSPIHPTRPCRISINDMLRGGDHAQPCLYDLLPDGDYLSDGHDRAVVQWWHQGLLYGWYRGIYANETQTGVHEKQDDTHIEKYGDQKNSRRATTWDHSPIRLLYLELSGVAPGIHISWEWLIDEWFIDSHSCCSNI